MEGIQTLVDLFSTNPSEPNASVYVSNIMLLVSNGLPLEQCVPCLVYLTVLKPKSCTRGPHVRNWTGMSDDWSSIWIAIERRSMGSLCTQHLVETVEEARCVFRVGGGGAPCGNHAYCFPVWEW